jgi:hypothetical protein
MAADDPTAIETSDQTAHSVHILAESVASHEEIAQLAYQYWIDRGRPIGSPDEDWFRAEQDVVMERLVWGHTATGSEAGRSSSSQKPSRKPNTR